MKQIPQTLARFIESHTRLLIVIAIIFSAAAVPGVLQIKNDTGFNALISADSKIAQDTARYQDKFGNDPIIILWEGQLDNIFSTDNLAIMSAMEQQFSQDGRYLQVNSPLLIFRLAQQQAEKTAQDFQNQLEAAQQQAAIQAEQSAAASGLDEQKQQQAAIQAQEEVLQKYQSQIEQMQKMGNATLDNPIFIKSVLYDTSGNINSVLQEFIPDNQHVIIAITPRGNMSDDEALQATTDIQSYLNNHPLDNIKTTVISGAKLIDAISVSMTNNIKLLLALAVVVMIIVLLITFPVRWRLLSLLMVGISALWTFGLMGYCSISLTMATMVVLPILIGLGIDFSIQYHNRYHEEINRGTTVSQAIITSISHMLPAVSISLLATVIGFITLFTSEIPMIVNFGVSLSIGIGISYIVALFLLNSVLYQIDRKKPIKQLQETVSKVNGRIEHVLLRFGKLAIDKTAFIAIIAVVLAAAGGIADRSLPVNTNYEELMPQDTPALVELREFRNIMGVGETILFMVEADNVASLEVLGWMKQFQDKALLTHPEIISINSPAILISQAAGGTISSQTQIDAILAGTPASITQQVLSKDHKTAGISFNLKYMSLEEIHNLLRTTLDEMNPPSGVQVSPVGNIVVGAKIMDSIVSSRMKTNLLCLAAVFVVLLVIYRRIDSTLFPIVPVWVVIAWSSLFMYLVGIPLNPLTAILGVLIFGVCTEYMILLTQRYEEEKKLGLSPKEAMAMAISKIGRAILASALTTLGGFGVLITSNFVMTRDFGIITVIGVFFCLLITMMVMPGVIVWYDNWRIRKTSQRTS
jgi:uncharacterized protein